MIETGRPAEVLLAQSLRRHRPQDAANGSTITASPARRNCWPADVARLRDIWGGVEGERFWQKLRGEDVQLRETSTSSISHSHVLAPTAFAHAGTGGALHG